jgi:hypothetical protein
MSKALRRRDWKISSSDLSPKATLVSFTEVFAEVGRVLI